METIDHPIRKTPRKTIRVAKNSLAFAIVDERAEAGVIYEPYITKSGISLPANLREAFKTAELLLHENQRALVMIDSPVLMVPIEEYDAHQQEELYVHSFPETDKCAILSNPLPALNTVAVFSMNKDLKLVIDDHFPDVKVISLMQPVWNYFHQRSFTGVRRKLYGYFHDNKLEIASFDKNRFKFCNCFEAAHSRDAAYFLLYVWKQLNLDEERDEMHIVGTIPDKDWLLEALRHYLSNVFVINPIADFNRAPITKVKNMPLDMMLSFMKG